MEKPIIKYRATYNKSHFWAKLLTISSRLQITLETLLTRRFGLDIIAAHLTPDHPVASQHL
jgi:hypothetical protein